MAGKNTTWMTLLAASAGVLAGAAFILEDSPALVQNGVYALGLGLLVAGLYAAIADPDW